jgi:hypothetical protein
MKDEDKTKEQLINELAELRQRVVELEQREQNRAEGDLRDNPLAPHNPLPQSPSPLIKGDKGGCPKGGRGVVVRGIKGEKGGRSKIPRIGGGCWFTSPYASS